MKYIVYRTTNMVNNKIYIGVHRLCNKEQFCQYKGSGKEISLAINKYGNNNFIRETLYVFNTPAEAYLKEKELVTKTFINEGINYNCCVGGMWGELKNTTEKSRRDKISLTSKNKIIPQDARLKISVALKGKPLSKERRDKISKALKGRKLTEKHRQNISKNTSFRFMSKESHEKTNAKNTGKKRTHEQITRMRLARHGI